MQNKFLKIFLDVKFFKRVIPSILRKLSFFKKNYILDLNDFKLNLSIKNSIERKIFLDSSYEDDKISFLANSIKDRDFDYFIDIGAYIGYYSLYLYKYKNIKNFISIEPNNESFLNLTNNINLNKFNITAYNFACSNINETKKLWYSNKNKQSGSAILEKDDKEYNKYSKDYKDNPKFLKLHNKYKPKDYQISKSDLIYENVESKKLDDLLTVSNKNIAVKIDVERHELSVLEGAKNIFFNNNNVFLQIELFHENKSKIFSLLKKNNYKLVNSIGWDYYFKNY